MEDLLRLNYRVNRYFTIYVAAFMLVSTPCLLAQVRTFQVEDTKLQEELPIPQLLGMFQDRQGFIWIYSYAGLSRYDGYEIIDYPSPYVDPSSVDRTRNRTVIDRHAHQYNTDELWFRTGGNGRLVKLDREKDRLVPFVLSDDTELFNVPDSAVNINGSINDAIFKNFINVIFADNDEIWALVANHQGIFRLIPDKKTYDLPIGAIKEIHYYKTIEETLDVTSSSFVYFYDNTDRSDSIRWLPRPTGLYEFNRNNGEYKKYQVIPDTAYNPLNNFFRVSTYIEDEMFFLGSIGDAITTFDLKTKQLKRHEIPIEALGFNKSDDGNFFATNCLFYDSLSKKVWIQAFPKNGSDRVTLLFDVTDHSFERVEFKLRNQDQSLFLGEMGNIIQDVNNTKWIINSDGIYKGSQKTQTFKKIPLERKIIEKNTMLPTLIGSTLLDGDSGLWLGGNNGILHVSLDNKQIKSYPLPQKNGISIRNTGQDILRGLIRDSKGNIWVGTFNGLFKFIPRTGKYQRVESLPPFNSILTGVAEDTKGNLWLSFMNKLYYYNPQNDTYIEYIFPEHKKNVPTFGLLVDPNDYVWLGNLFCFDPSKAIQRKGKMYIEDYEKFDFNSAYPQLVDSKGNLWAKSFTSGIFRIDLRTRKVTQFTKEDGLANNLTNGIIEDDDGNIWIATHKGLSRFDPKTETFNNFYESDGLLSDNFSYNTIPSKNSKGELFFYVKEGVTYFDPNDFILNPVPPKISFSGLEVLDKEVTIDEEDSPLTYDISQTKEITLDYWQNVITFKFAALHYDNPALNRYKILLENYDNDWRDIEHERKARYTNLSPGNYTFKVKAANSDGVWNEEGISVAVTILPPPWKTWWAYSLYGLIILGILYLARKQIIARERLRNNLKLERLELTKMQEVDRLKSEFFANVSHEFRTPLTLIKGPAQQLAEGTYGPEAKDKGNMVLRNTGRLLRLVNQLLDLSKLEAGKMRLEASEQDLIGYLKKLFSSFESAAEQRGITYMFHADRERLPLYLDDEKMEKVILNLLGNAFKFTRDGGNINLWVGTENDEGQVTIKVSDTGKGIPKGELQKVFDRFYQVDGTQTREFEGTGIGLSLTKQLVELHHGRISVESMLGKGTTFTITLPKGREHLNEGEIVSKIIVDPKGDHGETLVPVETEGTHEMGPYSGGLPLLLIVDDNPDMRTYISGTLMEDFNVITAVNGKEGLALAGERSPDLIISDVMMPVMDGLELCATLKQEVGTSHIPVILLTAKAGEEAKLKGLGTGADDYIMKPFSPRELQVRVDNLIRQRRALREIFRADNEIDPKRITVTSTDERFLQRALSIMEVNVSDAGFGAKEFMDAMGMSRTGLHVKMKALTGQSVSGFIRTYRLKHAAQLLEQDFGNIAQVAYESGFNGQPYFTKSFKELFGVTPKDYIANLDKK